MNVAQGEHSSTPRSDPCESLGNTCRINGHTRVAELESDRLQRIRLRRRMIAFF